MLATTGFLDVNRVSNKLRHADIRCCTVPATHYIDSKEFEFNLFVHVVFKKNQKLPYQLYFQPFELPDQPHPRVPRCFLFEKN